MPPDFDEFSLIEWIRRRASAHDRMTLGIGDDTAAIRIPRAADVLLTVDMLLEGTHFTIPPATPFEVGRKALAVNLSDIAAMAGRPLAAVVSVALPRGKGADFARELHAGIGKLAEEFGVALAGGDTNSWDAPLAVSVTLLGEVAGKAPVTRGGAQVGDWIFVTGDLGGSLAGKHFSFQPRIAEALALDAAVALHAMIDISDGLAADLHHILEESHVGAVLWENALPVSAAARECNDGRPPLEHALSDGEDFELLFTVSPDDGHRLRERPLFETPLTHIGEITAGRECELSRADGTRGVLMPAGWRHAL